MVYWLQTKHSLRSLTQIKEACQARLKEKWTTGQESWELFPTKKKTSRDVGTLRHKIIVAFLLFLYIHRTFQRIRIIISLAGSEDVDWEFYEELWEQWKHEK